MTFIPISQEYVIIINVFSPNMNLKYRSQNLIKLKEELDKYIIIVKIFTKYSVQYINIDEDI